MSTAMSRVMLIASTLFVCSGWSSAAEVFVTIEKVVGNRIAFVESPSGRGRGGQVQGGVANETASATQRGRGMRGGPGRAGSNTTEVLTAIVPANAKITAAMRERRTFEFRVGVELAGGMRHPVFIQMQKPLAARIVFQGNRITELNVITDDTDVNQRNTSPTGQAVIAVKPKRPPSK